MTEEARQIGQVLVWLLIPWLLALGAWAAFVLAVEAVIWTFSLVEWLLWIVRDRHVEAEEQMIEDQEAP